MSKHYFIFLSTTLLHITSSILLPPDQYSVDRLRSGDIVYRNHEYSCQSISAKETSGSGSCKCREESTFYWWYVTSKPEDDLGCWGQINSNFQVMVRNSSHGVGFVKRRPNNNWEITNFGLLVFTPNTSLAYSSTSLSTICEYLVVEPYSLVPMERKGWRNHTSESEMFYIELTNGDNSLKINSDLDWFAGQMVTISLSCAKRNSSSSFIFHVLLKFEGYHNYTDRSPPTIPPTRQPTQPTTPPKTTNTGNTSNNNVALILGIVIAGVVALVLLIVVIFLCLRRRRQDGNKQIHQNGNNSIYQPGSYTYPSPKDIKPFSQHNSFFQSGIGADHLHPSNGTPPAPPIPRSPRPNRRPGSALVDESGYAAYVDMNEPMNNSSDQYTALNSNSNLGNTNEYGHLNNNAHSPTPSVENYLDLTNATTSSRDNNGEGLYADLDNGAVTQPNNFYEGLNKVQTEYQDLNSSPQDNGNNDYAGFDNPS